MYHTMAGKDHLSHALLSGKFSVGLMAETLQRGSQGALPHILGSGPGERLVCWL